MPIGGDVNYAVAAQVLIKGTAYAPYSISVDINAYSLASTIEARVPLFPLDGKFNPLQAVDFGQIMQSARTIPFEVGLSYQATAQAPGVLLPGSAAGVPVPDYRTLEKGVVDEYTADYGANEVWIKGRSNASLFQDQRAGGDKDITKGLTGAKLVSFLASKQPSLKTQITASLASPIGKKNEDGEYTKTFRLLTQWDYMTEAALADGYIVTVHNDQLYYGPPAGMTSAPTINLAWGRDLTECVLNHASRRSHLLKVRCHYFIRKSKTHGVLTAQNGASGSDVETFETNIGYVKDHTDAQNRANAILVDLTKREFVANISLIPDENLISTISQFGANFFVKLDGVAASSSLLYHVKQVRVEVSTEGEEPTVTVHMALENHVPLGGDFSFV